MHRRNTSNLARTLALAAAVGTAVVVAAPGRASEPSSGTVSASNPSVSWTGEAETAPFAQQMREEQYRTCGPAICDTFALEVADPGDLTVQVKGEEHAVGFQVVAPDGTKVFADNFDGDPTQPVVIVVQSAKPGDYGIEIWQDATEADAHQLSGSAQLAPPPAPAPPPASASSPAPQPADPPAAPRLAVRTTRVRVRQVARRRVGLRVSASSPVTDVRAQILKGRRVVGRGALARLDGTDRVVVRTRKRLAPGRYTVGLSARAASGERVAVSRRLMVRRR